MTKQSRSELPSTARDCFVSLTMTACIGRTVSFRAHPPRRPVPNSQGRRALGTRLSVDEKRAHLLDIRCEHLIDQVLAPEVLTPERRR